MEEGVYMMREKRRSKRLPIDLELHVSTLFRQGPLENIDVDAPIHVFDVSKLGLGFITTTDLPMHYYFNAKLELGSPENSLYCVVQIIRKTPKDDGTISYGCEYVGMAPVLAGFFEEYERMLTRK